MSVRDKAEGSRAGKRCYGNRNFLRRFERFENEAELASRFGKSGRERILEARTGAGGSE
jgi:hypothetical protein